MQITEKFAQNKRYALGSSGTHKHSERENVRRRYETAMRYRCTCTIGKREKDLRVFHLFDICVIQADSHVVLVSFFCLCCCYFGDAKAVVFVAVEWYYIYYNNQIHISARADLRFPLQFHIAIKFHFSCNSNEARMYFHCRCCSAFKWICILPYRRALYVEAATAATPMHNS